MVPVTTELVHAAGDLAEVEGLRGTVVATADTKLLDAARRGHFDVSYPLQSPLATHEPEPGRDNG